jgi:hypothetical protein
MRNGYMQMYDHTYVVASASADLPTFTFHAVVSGALV